MGAVSDYVAENDDAQSQEDWEININETLAYPMSQSTVSLRYSGSFSSLKSLWGEENNTENDEVGRTSATQGCFFLKQCAIASSTTQQSNKPPPAAVSDWERLQIGTVQTRCQIARLAGTSSSSFTFLTS